MLRLYARRNEKNLFIYLSPLNYIETCNLFLRCARYCALYCWQFSVALTRIATAHRVSRERVPAKRTAASGEQGAWRFFFFFLRGLICSAVREEAFQQL